MTFEELGVNENLRRAIEELGFESPMPVQEKVIPHLLGEGAEGDVVALAQTGTGKTAAFGLPVLQRIDPEMRTFQSICRRSRCSPSMAAHRSRARYAL